MREVILQKVDQKGNHIPDDSTPTKEELRRDYADGKRILVIEQTRMNEFFVGENPNGDIDGDLVKAILAEAAETNIAAQVALEDWDARMAHLGDTKSPRTFHVSCDENGLVPPSEMKAAIDKMNLSVPRHVRRATRVDLGKMLLALNLMAYSVHPEDQKSKVNILMSYACGLIQWDELEADLEGRQYVRGEWKKSRIASSDGETRH